MQAVPQSPRRGRRTAHAGHRPVHRAGQTGAAGPAKPENQVIPRLCLPGCRVNLFIKFDIFNLPYLKGISVLCRRFSPILSDPRPFRVFCGIRKKR